MITDPIPQAAREIAEKHTEHERGNCVWHVAPGVAKCDCDRPSRVEALAREIAEYGKAQAVEVADHLAYAEIRQDRTGDWYLGFRDARRRAQELVKESAKKRYAIAGKPVRAVLVVCSLCRSEVSPTGTCECAQ